MSRYYVGIDHFRRKLFCEFLLQISGLRLKACGRKKKRKKQSRCEKIKLGKEKLRRGDVYKQ